MSSAKIRMLAGKSERTMTGEQELKFGSPEHLATLSAAEAADVMAKLASMTQTAAPKGVGGRAGLRARRASISMASTDSDGEGSPVHHTVIEENMTTSVAKQQVGAKSGWRSARRVLTVTRFSAALKRPDTTQSVESVQEEPAPEAIGLAGVLRYVKAIEDCGATRPGMLALKTGDVIAVTHEDENGSGWLGGLTIVGDGGDGRGGDGRWFSKHHVRRVKLETRTEDGATHSVNPGLIIGEVKQQYEAYVNSRACTAANEANSCANPPPEKGHSDNAPYITPAIQAAQWRAHLASTHPGGGCCAGRPTASTRAVSTPVETNGPEEGVPPARCTKMELNDKMEAARAATHQPLHRAGTPPRRKPVM